MAELPAIAFTIGLDAAELGDRQLFAQELLPELWLGLTAESQRARRVGCAQRNDKFKRVYCKTNLAD